MKKLMICIMLVMPYFTFSQSNSVLSTGDWYKISVQEEGVYKITYSNLESYGMDLTTIDPREICLYGNPNGMLPEDLNENYYTDLQPIAITIAGEYDGIFDETDYILFYAQDVCTWKKHEYDTNYTHTKSYYENFNYYFITVDSANAKRIEIQQTETADADVIPNYFNKNYYYENNLVNPGKSGKIWFGERFDNVDSLSFTIDTDENLTYEHGPSYINFNFACRSTEPSSVDIFINNQLVSNLNLPTTSNSPYTTSRSRQFDTIWPLGGHLINITLKYNKPNEDAKIWLDYFETNTKIRRDLLSFNNNFEYLHETDSTQLIEFNINSGHPLEQHVWNVDKPLEVKNISATITQTGLKFKLYGTQKPMKFVQFTNSGLKSVYSGSKIDNQNLHAIEIPDLLIITNNTLKGKAEELAEFHESQDGISSTVVTVDKIYNEFSSGSQDITAIRNFIRYLWEKSGNTKPENVLLFGDASYDYLDRIPNNTNIVPTHESLNTGNAITSFANDNYFAIINPEIPNELMVGIGRIPVYDIEEAVDAIEKIKRYYNNQTLNKWKNNVLLVADDSDNNLHEKSIDEIADIYEANNPEFNITKLYLDFFEIVEIDEGYRYPEVNNQITESINEGLFLFDYMGHGDENMLASENILSDEDIQNWTDSYYYPIFIVATGNISKYDDPENKYLGEKIIANPLSGGIATLSLTAAAYASSISMMNKFFTQKITTSIYSDNLTLGGLMKDISLTSEARKWSLLGDPAIKIPFPEYEVNTLKLNDINIENFNDTIAPGLTINIEGEIISRADESLVNDFNGTINLSVFTPPYIRSTLANQEGSYVEEFMVQDSILAIASGDVINGEFSITTTLPSEYYAEYGNLKLSWYAYSDFKDASGYCNDLMFGGSPVSIAENRDALNGIKVFPSFVKEQVNIQIPKGSKFNNLEVKVFNITGNEINISDDNISTGSNKLDLSKLPPGLYIMNLSTDINSRNFKLIKQ